MNYERPYYEDLNYHPMLFYVIFGIKEEEIRVSRSRHRVDVFPEGLDCVFLEKAENSEYMSEMIGGNIGKILSKERPALYEEIKQMDNWAVIRGDVVHDEDLNYMRNAIGFVQAFLESGAVGVLDLQTFSLYSKKEWQDEIFLQEFSPHRHVSILMSEEKDGVWLHTRGMRKFGRPDISIEKVRREEMDDAIQIINQMIHYSARGVFFSQSATMHTSDDRTYTVKPKYVNDFDNPDFNNAYYQISWEKV